MRVDARQSEDAVDVEDRCADELGEGAPEADFAEVVRAELVPSWPPGPLSGGLGAGSALEEGCMGGVQVVADFALRTIGCSSGA